MNLNVVLLGSQDPSILKQEIELELKKGTGKIVQDLAECME